MHNFFPKEDLKTYQVMVGVGIDLLEISRLQEKIQRHGSRFLDRIFTLQEQQYCRKKFNPYGHYASRFCAKEAFVKALGWGISERCSWLDIDVYHDEKGKPCLRIAEKVYKYLPWKGISVHLSISDERRYAQAVVIVLASVESLTGIS
ncbi:holo-[acyl-carrier-protein] synthase [Holospora undulata HU1]|uniref:Holo-[acyl-carrier-protein] synthase n=3 Tax=Holosporaceae TaxID=44746 RepID=A0A061JFZ4_9PROT|nr:holo-[acyl-carrier-protein] synthase [Holospora undulata HU1]GAJ46244.1 holo-[acyl-carrier-protein] synthase [Holospora elegans E1]